jgi:phosphoglucosamine mutase
MSRYPQNLLNVRTRTRLDIKGIPAIRDAIELAERELAESGRVLLRASGTESVIRVMVEGENEHQVQLLAKRLAAVVEKAAG